MTKQSSHPISLISKIRKNDWQSGYSLKVMETKKHKLMAGLGSKLTTSSKNLISYEVLTANKRPKAGEVLHPCSQAYTDA